MDVANAATMIAAVRNHLGAKGLLIVGVRDSRRSIMGRLFGFMGCPLS